MNIAIVTNMNGIGLQRDFELLRDFLEDKGHCVTGVQWDEVTEVTADLTIFLEVVPRDKVKISPVNWLFANLEWVKPEMMPAIHKYIDRIFAKTYEAERVLAPIFPGKVVYTGFLARDQVEEGRARRAVFLHVGGNSSIRGTKAVVDAWRWKKNGKAIDAPLIVVSTALEATDLPENVMHLQKVNEEELKQLQNKCKFHIYPSQTEGFGHAVREGLSVNAVVMVTDAPPLNELEECYLMEAKKVGKYNLADLYEVSALEIFESVQEVLSAKSLPFAPRIYFLACNDEFRELFGPQLKDVKPSPARMVRAPKRGALRIAFLGNFEAEESTENMVKWALENNGHYVEPLQENRTNFKSLSEAMDFNDAFFWIHTRGLLRISEEQMGELLLAMRRRGTPTVSMHLDKYWGIPEREELIGRHPFWKTQFVFTADGSRQQEFLYRGVEHYWMRPAVSEVYCHPGVPRDDYRCDVGFVGARSYHKEYPFREQLVAFLEKEYAGRFRHIEGLRGHGLNDFYASCKVVVGDCIFAGAPNYWSDRLPETCGRGGFLLHPQVSGMNTPTATYVPQSLESLKFGIEWWLGHDKEREHVRKSCAANVLRCDTWTVRMQQILEHVVPRETGEGRAKV